MQGKSIAVPKSTCSFTVTIKVLRKLYAFYFSLINFGEKKTYQICHPWRLKDLREYRACVRHMGREDSPFTLALDTRELARLLPR